MADNPAMPPDSGKTAFPSIAPGMNKITPSNVKDDEPSFRLGVNDKKPERDEQKLLAKMRKRFERCESSEAENRTRWSEALKFKARKQWSEGEARQRAEDGRPCLTVDRINPLVRQVTNEQRMNRPSIHINPIGDKTDKEAAKIFRGMVRAIERECEADIAYDTAYESAVSIGIGYIWLKTEWEDEGSMDQTIVIKRVRNPFTVYFDPDSKEPDGADARFAFITEVMPRDEFEDRFPDAEPVNWEAGGRGDSFKGWLTKDHIRVVNYFEVVHDDADLVKLDNGFTGYEDELDDLVTKRIETGQLKIIDKRKSHRRSVKWYEATGFEILSDDEWLGKWIPIVPVLGEEVDVEGKVKLSGLIEPAMDAQRMYNYWLTKYAEAVALAPTAPFVMAEGQLEGHEDEWTNANRTVRSVLTYKPDSLGGHMIGPPQRQPMPGIPEGFQHGAQNAALDIMATTGIRFDVAADKRNVDERSGKAIREFRQPQDLGSAHYLDNFQRSLVHIGRQLIDLIPKVYSSRRIVTILREDDMEQAVQIDPHASQSMGEKQMGDGKKMPIFNPNIGKYGVTAVIGPSYATRRIEAKEDMIAFANTIPQAAHLIMDLIAKNMDWEGSEEVASRLAKAVPAQFLQPDQKDVPPQMQAYLHNMEGQVKQLGQQLQAATKALEEKDKDRAIAQDKIDKDFEAKMIAILEKASAQAGKIAAEEARTHMEAVKSGHAMALAEHAARNVPDPNKTEPKPHQEKTDAP